MAIFRFRASFASDSVAAVNIGKVKGVGFGDFDFCGKGQGRSDQRRRPVWVASAVMLASFFCLFRFLSFFAPS